jgi:hypothetical protein
MKDFGDTLNIKKFLWAAAVELRGENSKLRSRLSFGTVDLKAKRHKVFLIQSYG